ncbi:AAA family ATPase [candidate division KSB1 bacterium]|nr:AAA family ATPase [candidate division KSB1 bacterium]
MPQLLGIRIKNYRSLQDVTLGQISYGQDQALPPLSCFIGPNGCGKSSLLDAFGFLSDCLREGVEAACDKQQRGGFDRLRTQGIMEPIHFDLYYRESPIARPISYSFEIGESRGIPIVLSEHLRQRRKGQKHGQPFTFLRLENSSGVVWTGESTEAEEGATKQEINLEDHTRLGITTLGQLSEHPRIVGLRAYIESWYLSYFIPDAARRFPPAGAQKHLDRTGENLGNVVQYLERNHNLRFAEILARIRKRIPGIEKIEWERSKDGRLLLKFNERGYQDPFFQQNMSDGTLKMFAYLLLLEDPDPPAFIGIEEPENGLYHRLVEQLAREFRRYAEQSKGTIQVLITTHSPQFVDALSPEQVWLMEKDENGFTQVKRTADMPIIKALDEEGIPLGSLWYSNHLEERFEG